MLHLQYAANSHPGRVRDENQDAWFAHPDIGLFGVSDGMGGQAAGQLASRIVAETLPGFLKKRLNGIQGLDDPQAPVSIASAIADLSRALVDESGKQPELRGMGATVAVALIRNDIAVLAHMGDSRIYVYRDKTLKQMTEDHNLAAALLRSGDANPSQLADGSANTRLIRYVGMREQPRPDVREPFALQEEDRILLCTDGLSNLVTDDRLRDILHGTDDPQSACQQMIDDANAAGGTDNITAMVIALEKRPLGQSYPSES